MPAPTLRTAVSTIDRLGACLVFPLENRPEPVSLWSQFHPRSRMRWEWDTSGDDRVVTLWHLREALSRSGKVAYVKWYRGRATFLSLPLFSALVHVLARDEDLGLVGEAEDLYRAYEESSPLSTKEVKRLAGLQGKANERAFERGMKQLWRRMLVVGWGEREEGSFPSLQVGASKWMLGEAWRMGRAMSDEEAQAIIDHYLSAGSAFRRELDRTLAPRVKRPTAK